MLVKDTVLFVVSLSLMAVGMVMFIIYLLNMQNYSPHFLIICPLMVLVGAMLTSVYSSDES